MTDLRVSSKRLRASSITEKHPEHSKSYAAAVTDWLPEKEMAQVQFENFLELCRFCKNNLRHDDDIYMYGYLGAFCSKKCRAKQMVCDIFKESLRNKTKVKKGKASKDEPLGNRKMITASTSQFYI